MNYIWIKARVCSIVLDAQHTATALFYQDIVDQFSSDLFDHVIDILATMYHESHISSRNGKVFFRSEQDGKAMSDVDYLRCMILRFVKAPVPSKNKRKSRTIYH